VGIALKIVYIRNEMRALFWRLKDGVEEVAIHIK